MNTLTLDQRENDSVRRDKNIALWVLQVGAAGMFFMAAYAKLSGAPEMVAVFKTIGLGQWFRYLTGGIELVGAVLLLIPSLSGLGALLMVPTMLGAVITHFTVLGGNFVPAAALLLVSILVLVGRGDQVRRLFHQ